MAHVYFNGRIVPEEEAVVSVHDRAILFGDGAYETMRSYAGRFFRFPEHLRRLRHTLSAMELDLPITDQAITQGALDLIEANRVPEARLRLTVTGGDHDGQIRLRRSNPPNLILTATELIPPTPETYANGVQVVISEWPVHSHSPLPRIKTINRLMHLMAKERALAAGGWDALFCNETGDLLEGTATNVFAVVDGVLCTPGLKSGLLAGVTRDAVLEVARAAGIPLEENPLPAHALQVAQEAFLTSTTIELLPVVRAGEIKIGNGAPGPVWERLHRLYREAVQRETGVDLQAG